MMKKKSKEKILKKSFKRRFSTKTAMEVKEKEIKELKGVIKTLKTELIRRNERIELLNKKVNKLQQYIASSQINNLWYKRKKKNGEKRKSIYLHDLGYFFYLIYRRVTRIKYFLSF